MRILNHVIFSLYRALGVEIMIINHEERENFSKFAQLWSVSFNLEKNNFYLPTGSHAFVALSLMQKIVFNPTSRVHPKVLQAIFLKLTACSRFLCVLKYLISFHQLANFETVKNSNFKNEFFRLIKF